MAKAEQHLKELEEQQLQEKQRKLQEIQQKQEAIDNVKNALQTSSVRLTLIKRKGSEKKCRRDTK